MAALMSLDSALQALLERVPAPPAVEARPLAAALGGVLAEDIHSSIDVPPCDNSAMDGYALAAADLDAVTNPQQALPVSARIVAGDAPGTLAAGTAARIFTGAPIPRGADTVVMQENTESSGDSVRFTEAVQRGRHIRPAGQDIAAGARVLSRGRRLQPQDVGVLASIGIVEVPLYRPLKVALLSTGDELVEPGQPLASGKIYNSNRYTLSALLVAMGCEVIDGGIVTDDLDSTREQLLALAQRADVVLSSGGVSVGEEDHVKAALTALGELSLWKLNIKPGKPLAFGHIDSGAGAVPFIGLPGNPSSVFVTFALVAAPFLRACQGRRGGTPVEVSVAADFEWSKPGSRQQYLRARVSAAGQEQTVALYSNQSSGVLLSTSWANALVVLPPGATVRRGDPVSVLLLSELIG